MRTTDLPPVGNRIDVDGRQLWMHRSGTGGPAVVFVPGGGGFGLDHLLAHDRVAGLTTSVLYDRAGTGWSDDTDLPRTADDVTDELRALLHAAAVPAPYLLVGHSLGGIYVRRFAQRFPGEVAGLLLLDPAHEDWDRYQPEHLQLARNLPADAPVPQLTEDLLAQGATMFMRQLGEVDMLAAFPEPVREMLITTHLSPERLPTGFREGGNLLALLQELREGGAGPDVPLIVLSAAGVDSGQTMFQTEALLREQIAGSERLFDAIAAAATHGEHRSLPDASHATMPWARPDAVAAAAGDLLDRVRAARA